jgi:hypothetical protein
MPAIASWDYWPEREHLEGLNRIETEYCISNLKTLNIPYVLIQYIICRNN